MKNNVLMILAGLFALSLIGRSFAMSVSNSGSMLAVAGSIAGFANDQGATNASASKKAVGDENGVTATEFFDGEVCATGPMLQSIKEREASLIAREEEMEKRRATMKAVETRVEERLAMLNQMNDKLSTAMNALEAESSEDVTHLAAMYENMKPQEAAKIFNQMDPSFAAGFLRIMNSSNAGMILSGMEPQKAYSISVILANRNAGYRQDLSN